METTAATVQEREKTLAVDHTQNTMPPHSNENDSMPFELGDLDSLNVDQVSLLDLSYSPLTQMLKMILSQLQQQKKQLDEQKMELRKNALEQRKKDMEQRKIQEGLNDKINALKDLMKKERERVKRLENKLKNQRNKTKTIEKTIIIEKKGDEEGEEKKEGGEGMKDGEVEKKDSDNQGDDQEKIGDDENLSDSDDQSDEEGDESKGSKRKGKKKAGNTNADDSDSDDDVFRTSSVDDLLSKKGNGVDPGIISDLFEKIENNKENISDVQMQIQALNSRIDNVVSLMKSVSDMAKKAEDIGNDSRKKADFATNEAMKASEEALLAQEKAEDGIQRANRADKMAFQADEKAKLSLKQSEKTQTLAEKSKKRAQDAQKKAETVARLCKEQSKDIQDNTKNIKLILKRLKEFGNSKSDSNSSIIRPMVPVKQPKKRSKKSDEELATKKEVQLLRSILLRFEGDIKRLYDYMDAIQNQQFVPTNLSREHEDVMEEPNTKIQTPNAIADSDKKQIEKLTKQMNALILQLADLQDQQGLIAERFVTLDQQLTTGIDFSDDTKKDTLGKDDRPPSRPLVRAPSRDVRSKYVDGDEFGEKLFSGNEKMFDTLASTLNELLGRVEVVEYALAELQAMFDSLSQEKPAKTIVKSGKKSGIDESQLKKLLNKYPDQKAFDKLEKQLQSLLPQIRVLQKLLEKKADIDQTATRKQLSDVENSLLKKVDRKELQELISKLASQQRSTPNYKFTPLKKSSSDQKNSQLNEKAINDIEKLKEAVTAHTEDINTLFKVKADKAEVFRELSDYKEMLDRLGQSKADAHIVARKAERDYVDNLSDKIRKELENYIRHANAHTSDALAKELDMLRGAVGQKVGKSDLKKLRDMLKKMQQHDKKKTDGGLAGHQQFRCLSCNRMMDTMKTRPGSMNFMNYINHLPNPKMRMLPRSMYNNDPLSDALKRAQQIGKQSHQTPSPEHFPPATEEGTPQKKEFPSLKQ